MLLHQKITEARKNQGLTQEELADKANVTTRTIQRIESGQTVPRNFTLKAIAAALHLSFHELVGENNSTYPSPQSGDNEEAIHFLQTINLSSFAYLLIPYVHFLIPMWLLKRRKDASMLPVGRKIIRAQIYWVVMLNLSMLAVFGYNFSIARNADNSPLHYLWPVLVMYLANAVLILVTHFKIRRRLS